MRWLVVLVLALGVRPDRRDQRALDPADATAAPRVTPAGSLDVRPYAGPEHKPATVAPQKRSNFDW